MTVRNYRFRPQSDALLVEVDWFSGIKAQHRSFGATSLVPVEDDSDA